MRRMLRGTGPVRPDDAVVLDADGDRLRVAEPGRGRMTAAAGVVVVQARQRVKPQQPSHIGEAGVHRPAQPLRQRGLHAAGETGLGQRGRQILVELAPACGRGAVGRRRRGGGHSKSRQKQRAAAGESQQELWRAVF